MPTSPAATAPCSHRCFKATCRILPRPKRLHMDKAAELSVHNCTRSSHPKSCASDLSPMPSIAALPSVYSSASPLLIATDTCVDDHVLTATPDGRDAPACRSPRPKTPRPIGVGVHGHLVEVRVRLQELPYHLGAPTKYLASRFNFASPRTVGRDISRQTSFAAYCMSGRSWDK